MSKRRRSIVFFLLSGIMIIAARGFSAEETGELHMLLSEGHQLFQQASNTEDEKSARLLYQKALYRFERVIEEGQGHNGKLFYNIGNTYYRLGDTGRAILFYRRAQLLIPADPNLKHNLRYVRSLRVDLIPSRQDSPVFRTLFIWHYSFPPLLKASLFIAAFWGTCILTAHVLLLPNLRKRWKRIFLAVLGGIALMMSVSLVADEIRLRTLRDGVIIAEEVVARKGDGIAYQRSFVDPLHHGTEFKLLEERAGWYYIELSDGRTGWIPASAAEMVLPTTGGG
jgi:tetratricopeptide (TPR) repeat protein